MISSRSLPVTHVSIQSRLGITSSLSATAIPFFSGVMPFWRSSASSVMRLAAVVIFAVMPLMVIVIKNEMIKTFSREPAQDGSAA
jgi:hypothetical protein